MQNGAADEKIEFGLIRPFLGLAQQFFHLAQLIFSSFSSLNPACREWRGNFDSTGSSDFAGFWPGDLCTFISRLRDQDFLTAEFTELGTQSSQERPTTLKLIIRSRAFSCNSVAHMLQPLYAI